MGLRLKFNLVLFITTVIGVLVSGLVSHKILQDNAREEVLDMARMMMESAVAVRSYTVNEVRPLLKVQQRRQFIPQTVPAYAAARTAHRQRRTRRIMELAGYPLRLGKPTADDLVAVWGHSPTVCDKSDQMPWNVMFQQCV